MKNVLRELQVDWEDFLKVDFNPLPHAYALKIQSGRADALKNMYHALQATMDRVVEDNYEKLSQSVSLYEEIYDKYLQCSALLAENKDLSRKVGKRMAETVDSNLEMEIGEEKKKLDVLEKIQNINDKLKLIKMQRAVHLNDLPGNVDFFVTSVQFMDQMDGLYAITEMRQNLLAFGKFLFKNISERLEILVFTLDEIENHEIDVLLNLIKRLGAIEKFDNRLYKNFKKNLFGNFEALTTSKNLVPKIVKYAQNVFRRIARMKKKIIIPEMENFFEEEKENKIKIFRESDDVVIKLIIYEIKRLVTAYSDEEGFVSNIFHVEYIENTVNFADLFQTRFKISKIFQNVNLTPEYGEYTVTRPPECAFLIDFHKFVSKKIELSNVKLISERTIGMDINHQNTKMHAGDKILHEIMRMTNKMISDVYRHKDIHFKREVERILNKENAHNLNLTSGTVHYIQKITNLFKKYKTKFDFFPSFFDCTDLIFDKLEADLQIAFSSVIADTLDLDFQDFKKTIPKKRIEISEYPQNSFSLPKARSHSKKFSMKWPVT